MSLLDENQPGPVAVPDPEPEPESLETEYVVFKLREQTAYDPALGEKPNETWEKVGVARGSRSVVLKHVAGQTEGIFCATPSRSWRPAQVGVKVDVTVTEL